MTINDTYRPKVLFLMHLPPPVHGAAMAGNYIKNSNRINNKIDGTYINLATNKELNLSGKGNFKKIVTFFAIIKNVLLTLKKCNYQLCHMSLTASGPGFYKDLVLVYLLKRRKTKIIYHFHNKGVAAASQNRLNNWLYKYAFKDTWSILLSPHLYKDVSRYVSETNVFYCPYGIPISENDCSKKVEKQNKICNFLFLSNMIEEKGVYILLDAIKKLKNDKVNFHCHFVGGWSDITPIKFDNYLKLNNISDVASAHGPKYNKEKESFYLKSDVFIFPTFYHYETFGIVNLEAMQHCLPIISTPEGGIPDIVVNEKTGFLVPKKDSQQLAERMKLLADRPDIRKEMGIAGKQRFEELFTIEKFEERLSDILIKACEK
ncbi:glycosyltransferase [Euzebyella marina]|uniref:Glycosyltransferase n=1 Tax=Euzebyella marina TaxID=1761453 RepID=A0A3G2L321_9FLAO|nr:glycosyltransferase family 4 protein [Euzebyella marina]AYN66677.1 glycosyltransferase [Euzebyella marina]